MKNNDFKNSRVIVYEKTISVIDAGETEVSVQCGIKAYYEGCSSLIDRIMCCEVKNITSDPSEIDHIIEMLSANNVIPGHIDSVIEDYISIK